MSQQPQPSGVNSDARRDLGLMLMDFDARVEQVKREASLPARGLAVFERAVGHVDRNKVRELQGFIRSDQDWIVAQPAFKYLDLPRYLADKSRWIVELDLDSRSPIKILDLGVGGGHFPFLAALYGHEVTGIDMDNAIYARLLELYSVRRNVQMITPGTPLMVEGRFDLVTALQMTFNRMMGRAARGRPSVYWSTGEWAGFLDNLCSHLNFPGQIFFGLNRQPHPEMGKDHADDLLLLFGKNGAFVDRKKHSVRFNLSGPIALKD